MSCVVGWRLVTAKLFAGAVARNVRTWPFAAFSGRRFTGGFETNLKGQFTQQAPLFVAVAGKPKDSITADAGKGRSFCAYSIVESLNYLCR